MRYLVNRPGWPMVSVAAAIMVALASIVALTLLGRTVPAEAAQFCSGVQIKPGDDLDAIVNRDPRQRATTFCVNAASSGTLYKINNTVVLRAGDKLLGRPGPVVTRGPARYGVPPVKIRNGGALDRLVALHGSNVQLKWLDIAGAVGKFKGGVNLHGSGKGIAAGQTNGTALMSYLAVHDNAAQGIGSMNGKLLHSNIYNNGAASAFQGETAAGVKGVDEYEAAYNYIHNNPANGIWCDHGCAEVGPTMPNGFWAHHNLIANNGRWGVRVEFSPRVKSGVRTSRRTALVENNEIHANGYKGSQYGGGSMLDAQNAMFRNNYFGPKTIAGVGYGANVSGRALVFSDSGRADRTDLWNGDAVGNSLGGEQIKNCEEPDNVVYCAANQ